MSTQPPQRAAGYDLTSGSLIRDLARLGIPLAAARVLRSLYQLVDMVWLGDVSTDAVGALGVSMPVFFLVIFSAMGFGAAGTALVAQYAGSGDYEKADRAAGQTLLFLCVASLVLVGPTIVFAPSLLRLFQVPGEMVPEATQYLRLTMTGMPFLVFSIAYGSILRALGDTVTVLIITAFSTVANIVLDPFLILGWWVFPRLEVQGAALVTVLSQVLAATACTYFLMRGRLGLKVRLRHLKPNLPILRKMVMVGLPLTASNTSNAVGINVYQVMINSLGRTVVAAATIGMRLVWFFNIPAQAMAMAAAPVVGQALGAGKPGRARRAVWVGVGTTAALMLPVVVFLTLGGKLITGAIRDEAAVVAEAGLFFLIVPASSYIFGVLMVLMSAFYGSGHTRPAMVIHILRLWAFRLPAALLLGFVLGMGSIGVYLGMVFGNLLAARLALGVFLSGEWEEAVIETAAGPERAETPAGEGAPSERNGG